MITVTLPIYYKQTKKRTVMMGLNWYRNVHHMTNNRVKIFIAGVIKDTIEGEPILDGEIHVHYKIFLKRRGSDGGNIRSVIEKYALDGIKEAGYITEDTFDIVSSDSAEYHYDKEFPRAEITLTRK